MVSCLGSWSQRLMLLLLLQALHCGYTLLAALPQNSKLKISPATLLSVLFAVVENHRTAGCHCVELLIQIKVKCF
jgi:hypothetical protein